MNFLKRCQVCILPETVPFIEFDDKGVCRHCRNTKYSTESYDPDALKTLVSGFSRNSEGNDCIVALSGGRDSSYVLHYAVENLGLNPLVFIYDWGMLTETGRENQLKMCRQLRLKEVFLQDRVEVKRRNIRKNLLAWLRLPNPGMIPLFMAGDKPFFYHAKKIRDTSGLSTILFGITDIEAEDFKEGFCGVRTESFNSDKRHYGLYAHQKLQVMLFYAKQFLKNPRYINASIAETLFGFYSYYLLPHNYYTNLYKYVRWDELQIVSTLKTVYDWRSEPDSTTSWRTGDASAPLVHYLFLKLAGFTENDFLRSNQKRRGMLSREEALKLLENENKPREEGLRYFCKLIELDYNFLIEKVEQIVSSRRP